ILFFSLPLKTIANNKITYDVPKTYTYQKNNISASGTYPSICNLKNKTFEKNINTEITNLIDKTITSKKNSNGEKFNISYKTYLYGNTLSIVIFFKNTLTSEVIVKSIVIDVANSKKMTINSFLGVNGVSYANKVVLSKADTLNLKSPKVTESTPFYVENGKVVIIYGAGEVTFVQKGNITISVDPKKIKNYSIPKSLYYTKPNYNVKMVPLRAPLEALGYKISWDKKNNAISVSSEQGEFISYLKVNVNKYSKGSFAARSLEFAPENKNNLTYVPISFFSDIMGLLYSIDGSENIVISKYTL
ncbi:MAG: copper amine oxidase N-terminal domain-containing protein, partial [Eubacteriales bacterium]|nr:copper amine oxidase N-terminal domain-containing protein [Eubacteriales bacterium]